MPNNKQLPEPMLKAVASITKFIDEEDQKMKHKKQKGGSFNADQS